MKTVQVHLIIGMIWTYVGRTLHVLQSQCNMIPTRQNFMFHEKTLTYLGFCLGCATIFECLQENHRSYFFGVWSSFFVSLSTSEVKWAWKMSRSIKPSRLQTWLTCPGLLCYSCQPKWLLNYLLCEHLRSRSRISARIKLYTSHKYTLFDQHQTASSISHSPCFLKSERFKLAS